MPYNRVALTIIALVTVSACVQDQQSASAIAPQPTSCTGGTPCDERLAANLDGLMPVTPSTGITTTTGFASWKVCKARFSSWGYSGAAWFEPHGSKVHVWMSNSRTAMDNYRQLVRSKEYGDVGVLPWRSSGNVVQLDLPNGNRSTLILLDSGSFRYSFINQSGGENIGDGICSR